MPPVPSVAFQKPTQPCVKVDCAAQHLSQPLEPRTVVVQEPTRVENVFIEIPRMSVVPCMPPLLVVSQDQQTEKPESADKEQQTEKQQTEKPEKPESADKEQQTEKQQTEKPEKPESADQGQQAKPESADQGQQAQPESADQGHQAKPESADQWQQAKPESADQGTQTENTKLKVSKPEEDAEGRVLDVEGLVTLYVRSVRIQPYRHAAHLACLSMHEHAY